LGRAGLRTAGAGVDAEQASRPAELATGLGRVLVWSVASESSGTPASWAAQPDRAGVCVVRDLSTRSAAALAARVRRDKGPGDLAVVSVHWGSNWGYDVPRVLVDFAHRLVDDGVDVVHGHSSHHPRPIEVYRGRLIVYGCGDLINDYEGIGGHARYRDDLRLLYLVLVDASTGELQSLQMVPMRARRLRLERASSADSDWMCRQLDRVSRGCRVLPAADRGLGLSMG
ncbi:MAG: CapA family protein, partial [Nocardioidaceae bacterium]